MINIQEKRKVKEKLMRNWGEIDASSSLDSKEAIVTRPQLGSSRCEGESSGTRVID